MYGDSHTLPRRRLRYDRLYLARMGPGLDRIILLSLWVVARRVLGRRSARRRRAGAPQSAARGPIRLKR